MLTQTRFGNWIQATGGNPSAARSRGVNVERVKVVLFMLSLGDGGLRRHHLARSAPRPPTPTSGTGYELEVIAMVVIGGTALTGGRGTIIGTVLGVFILRLMRNGIVHDRRAGPRLQHLHRRDHPRHDGAAFRA